MKEPVVDDTRRIRTPDQRLRVFISSTLGELAEERQAARAAVEQLRLAPVMFELGARPHPPRALYRSYLEQSDIFVGIYWQRYGWVAPDMDISGLQDEYVLSAGMPRLIYIKRPADEVEPRLAQLLQQVEDEGTASYRPFRDAEELRTLLLDDLVLMLTERFDGSSAPRVDLPPTTNLPTPASAFIGRTQLLADVGALLQDRNTRLVTLTGPGGTGKTRLALEVARAAASRFRDGVFLIDLTEERQPEGAYAAMLRALPVGKTSGELPLEALHAALRDREMLLVLDNFEQVTDAAAGLAELLESCAGIKALVTSRVALHVRAERRFAVPPMQVAPADRSDAGAAAGFESEAVRLFAERASAVDPSFALSGGNIADVAAICARLDGLPLAIELAAARISLFSVDELRERVTRHIGVLGRGGSDMPERQQTLRRTLEWSNDLLGPSEQAVFRFCSLFFDARIVDIEATAARVEELATLDVIEDIGSLVDKSLVHSVSRADGRPRFSMLQTIRDYASDELQRDAALAASARGAHAEHYTALAARLGAATQVDRNVTLAALASDLLNFRAAWSYWVERENVARLNDLLEPLWGYYETGGNYRAAVELGEELLAVLRRQPETPARARDEIALEMSLAQSLIAVGGYSAAVERRIAAALDQSTAAGEAPQRFPALRSLATLRMLRAEFARCADVTPVLLSIAQEQGDASLLSEAHLLEGMSALWRDGMQQAVHHVDQAVEYSRAGSHPGVRLRVGPDPGVLSHAVSGLMKWLAGFPDQAAVTAARALQVAEEAGHPYSTCYALFHVSLLDLWREDLHTVGGRATTLLERAEAFEYPVWQALGHILRGTATVAAGDADAGLAEVADGFALYRGLATPPVFWPALLTIRAAANLLAGRLDEARRLVEAAASVDHDDPTAGDIDLLHGDILMLSSPPDAFAAADCYRRAADGAAAAGLRMLELQATTRLTNLSRGTSGGAAEAERLRGVVAWFTEGFDTPQYAAAQAALDAAGPNPQ